MGVSRRLLPSAVVAALVAGSMAAGAAPAAADSLAFIKDGNVWLSQPDGSGRYQVTFDGTAAAAYESPTQSDAGVVVAVRQAPGQRRQIYRMTQSGGLLNAPIDTPAPGTGALGATVSPNGALVAYYFVTAVNDPFCAFCVTAANSALLSHSERFTGATEVGTPNGGGWPSWVDDSTITLGDGAPTQWYYRLGMPEMAEWFNDSLFTNGGPLSFLDAEVAPSGDHIALVRGDNQESLRFLKANGPPPATPTPVLGCDYENPTGKFASPTWSGDGRKVAWAEGDGIWLADVGDLSCPLPQGALVVPGATEPDLSRAALNPGARPACGNPGNPTACTGQQNTTPTPPPPPPPACGPCPPSAATIAGRLDDALTAGVQALRRQKLAGLVRAGRLSVPSPAPPPGTLVVRLSTHGKALGAGSHTFAAAGRSAVALKLTSKGRRRLRHARKLTATLTLTFTPKGGGKATKVSQSVQLKR